ncbi:hypothetical protein [Ruminococcus flavefaciens]|uniref:MalT-like TPR region domain-containing protein n=1 Tax=Ruminococcus flavefaciens 007c TaxID=1341157 RepID=W7UEG1_RUMFL|nr:hypothetical protein [Ruminococcus flavefaciens]EWM53551.1 hypothetical protein RF007C_07665 [Ruminococcus flavefaciens 007c]
MKNTSNNKLKGIAISFFLRWATLFIIIFLLLTLIDAFTALSDRNSGGSLTFRLIFAAAASVVVNVILYFLVAPRMNKNFRAYRTIIMSIASEGYSQRNISDMEKQLEICMQDREKNEMLVDQYSMFLGEAYISLHRYAEAEKHLDTADYDKMAKAVQATSNIKPLQNIIMLHVLWIQLFSARRDKEATEHWVRKGEKYFGRMRGKDEVTDYFIDTAYFESLLVHDQYSSALELLKKYESNEALEFGVSLDKARCLKLMGSAEKANKYFNKAYELAANDWRRLTVELERGVSDSPSENTNS